MNWLFFFSSPELKAQVSCFDRRLSVVRLFVYLSLNFYIYHWANFKLNLGTNHPLGEGIKIFQMKGNAPLQGEIIAKE
jgi:hypothetical protein